MSNPLTLEEFSMLNMDNCDMDCLFDIYNRGGYEGCDQACFLSNYSMYGFWPSRTVPIIAVVLFSLSTAGHFAQTIWSRHWWTILMTMGGLLEIIGWAARLASNSNPFTYTYFIMQIVCLIIAPAFFSATMYVMLGIAVRKFGSQYCRLSPTGVNVVFVTCDIISLVIQAVGGGMAAEATDGPGDSSKTGTNIMVAGIFFQVASMTAFVIVSTDMLYHMSLRRPVGFKLRRSTPADEPGAVTLPIPRHWRWKAYLASLTIGTALIFLRCVYRAVELLNGWHGPLLVNEGYLEGLDGLPMLLFMLTFNILHPTIALGRNIPGKRRNVDGTLEGKVVDGTEAPEPLQPFSDEVTSYNHDYSTNPLSHEVAYDNGGKGTVSSPA